MVASDGGRLRVVAELLKAGAHREAVGPNGMTALSMANLHGHAAVVALLERA
jgi:ankyrin repeat protein